MVAVWEREHGGGEQFTQSAFRPAGGAWQSAVNVSEPSFGGEPEITVDPQGDAVAVWRRREGNDLIIQSAFRPAGGAWQEPVNLSASGGSASVPRVATDPQGDAVAVWQSSNGSGEDFIQSAFRPAGGAWQEPVNLSQPDADSAKVVLDAQGDAVAVWNRFDGGTRTIQTAFRPNGGSWQEAINLSASEPGNNAEIPSVAVDSSGDTLAVWEFGKGGGQIVQSAFKPAGGPWQSPVNLSAGGEHQEPHIAMDSRGDAVAVWNGGGHTIQSAFRPAGGPWQGVVNLSQLEGAFRSQVAIDSHGDAVAVWERYSGANEVIQSAVRPAGGSWHSPVNLSETGEAIGPAVAIDPEGNAVAVWQHRVPNTNFVIQASGYDAAGPQLNDLSMPSTGTAGQPVAFSVSPLDVWSALGPTTWSFGDGSSATGASVAHAYAAAGSYEVTLESEDVLGNRTSTSGTIQIAPLPIPPTVTTEPASSVTQTSATLNATVNPKDETVSDCHFEYGSTMLYGTSAPCSSLPGSGESPVAVSAVLSMGSLSETTTYHYRITSTSVNGTSYGSDVAFTTLPDAPAVVTEAASSVTQNSATLNATVNPEGASASCTFEYGTAEAYGSSAPCSSAPGSGESPVLVAASLASLATNTTYHFRITATNSGGTSHGADQSFTTLPVSTPAHWFKSGTKLKQGTKVPIVSWGGAANVSPNGASAEVNCKTVASGNIENPVGGASGRGETTSASYYECKAPKCEAEVAESPLGRLGYKGIGFVAAYNLPWNDELIGSPPSQEEMIGAPPSGNLGAGFPEGYPANSQPPDGEGTSWGAKGAIGLISGCQIFPNPEGAPALGGERGQPSRVAGEVPYEGELRPEIGGSLNGAASAANPALVRFAGAASGELESSLGPGKGGTAGGAMKYLGYETQSPIKVE